MQAEGGRREACGLKRWRLGEKESSRADALAGGHVGGLAGVRAVGVWAWRGTHETNEDRSGTGLVRQHVSAEQLKINTQTGRRF